MKQISKFVKTGLAIAAGVVIVACGGEKKTGNAEKEILEKVRVQTIAKEEIDLTLEYPCSIIPFEENYMAPASPGRVEKVYVEIGDHVKKGQVLAQMDRTQLINAEVQMETLKKDYARLDTLMKTGSIAQQQYDQIKAQYDVAKTNVDFLKDNTKIIAPFSGVVAGKYFEDGELYSGAPNTPAGKAAIVYLTQIDNLKAIVDLPEHYLPLIKTGTTVFLESEIYKNEKFEGKIFKIYPTVDAASHNFRIEIRIPNVSNKLRPGMFGRVNLDMGKTDAIVVLSSAVLKMQGSNDRYVFVDKDGFAIRVPVQIGKRFDDKVELKAGELKVGDRLIVSGQSRLFDSTKIEVVY